MHHQKLECERREKEKADMKSLPEDWLDNGDVNQFNDYRGKRGRGGEQIGSTLYIIYLSRQQGTLEENSRRKSRTQKGDTKEL